MWQINPLAVKQVTSSAGLYSLAKHSIILCDTDYMAHHLHSNLITCSSVEIIGQGQSIVSDSFFGSGLASFATITENNWVR
jgi:hypothetical protein